MTASAPSLPLRKKLLTRIASIQRQADVAKKAAKLAKAGFKTAKQKFKEAKRAAKKHRKELKALKAELAALAAKNKPVRKPAAKPVAKRSRPATVAAEVPSVQPEDTSVSVAPVESVPPAQ